MKSTHGVAILKLVGFSIIPLIAAVLTLGVFTGSYTLLAPDSLTAVVPLLLLPPSFIIIPPFIFLVLVWHLRKDVQSQQISLKIPLLMFVLNILSLAYFIYSWSYGFEYQRIGYSLESIFFIAIFWAFWSYARNKATYRNTILLSLILCCWLFFVAFPIFGALDF